MVTGICHVFQIVTLVGVKPIEMVTIAMTDTGVTAAYSHITARTSKVSFLLMGFIGDVCDAGRIALVDRRRRETV